MAVVKHGVSTNTPERMVFGPGAVYIDFYDADSPGTLLGATEGGNTFEINRTIRDVRPDGSKGKVKGFRRVEEVEAFLTVKMLEFTAENLRRALALNTYSTGSSDVSDEAVGDGNGTLTEFALDHGSVLENSDVVTVNASAVVRGTDYTVDYDTGELQFFSAVTDGHAIVASYTYVSGDAVMVGQEVADNAYCDNVAIVATHTGFTATTDPIIFIVKNVLCDTALSLGLMNNEEVVSEVKFSGHYTAADLVTEPWEIRYPS